MTTMDALTGALPQLPFLQMFDKIKAKNREGMALAALPYQIGVVAGVSAAIASLPLVSSFCSSIVQDVITVRY